MTTPSGPEEAVTVAELELDRCSTPGTGIVTASSPLEAETFPESSLSDVTQLPLESHVFTVHTPLAHDMLRDVPLAVDVEGEPLVASSVHA